MWKAVAVAGFLAASCYPVGAQQTTGNAYYDLCNQNDPYLQNSCTGYTLGLLSGLLMWSDYLSTHEPTAGTICIPQGVRAEQIRDVLMNFMRANPQYRQNLAAFSAYIALAEAFPCS